MSEIASNYPRATGPTTEKVDLARLYNVSHQSIMYATLIVIGVLILNFVPLLGLKFLRPIYNLIINYGFIGCIVLAFSLYKTSSLGYEIVHQLRGKTPAIRPWILGLACAFSGILFFGPTFFTMDYMLTNSDPMEDFPQRFSWSPMSLNFIGSMIMAILFGLMRMFASNYVIYFGLTLVSSALLLYSLRVASKIVKKINTNLVKLTKAIRAKQATMAEV